MSPNLSPTWICSRTQHDLHLAAFTWSLDNPSLAPTKFFMPMQSINFTNLMAVGNVITMLCNFRTTMLCFCYRYHTYVHQSKAFDNWWLYNLLYHWVCLSVFKTLLFIIMMWSTTTIGNSLKLTYRYPKSKLLLYFNPYNPSKFTNSPEPGTSLIGKSLNQE